MAKSKSPYRIDEHLMHHASIAATAQHRNPIEQIEYWAELGRKIERQLSLESLYQVSCGFLSLKTEPTADTNIDPQAVFDSLEEDRKAGRLAMKAPPGTVRYQASVSHPGKLEEVHPDGHVVVGTFKNGAFKPEKSA